MVGAVGAGLAAAAAYLARYRTMKRAWTLDDTTLRIGGHSIARARIESGMVVDQAPDKEKPGSVARLDLQLADGEPIELGFANREEAEALLQELALDPRRRRIRVALDTLLDRSLGVGIPVVMLSALAAPLLALGTQRLRSYAPEPLRTPILVALLLLVSSCFVALAARFSPELVIGRDGLVFRSGSLRRRRYIMYEQVDGVTASLRAHGKGKRWSLELSMIDGTTVLFGTAASDRRAEVEASVQHIHEAIEAWKLAAISPQARLDQLEQKDVPIADWLANLKALAHQKAGYRSTALSNEELEGVVADASAPARHRIGAAVVLTARDERAGRERVRVAADTSVSPKIRVALDAIARGEDLDDAVQEAIDEENSQKQASP